ncbi:hypothetical protein JCM10212_000174 [Sporobolomyces blumeae]
MDAEPRAAPLSTHPELDKNAPSSSTPLSQPSSSPSSDPSTQHKGTRRKAVEIRPWDLVKLLERRDHGKGRDAMPLVVDTRNLSAYLGEEGRVRGSINVAFPTLLCKRFSKGNVAQFSLSSFITTPLGKTLYSTLASLQPSETRDVIVIDDHLDRQVLRTPTCLNPGAVLLSVLEQKDHDRRAEEDDTVARSLYYLDRPLGDAAKREERLRKWIVLGEPEDEVERLMADQGAATGGEGYNEVMSPAVGPTRLAMGGLPPTVTPAPRSHSLPPFVQPRITSPRTSSAPPLAPVATTTTTTAQRPGPPKLKRIDTSENLLAPHSRPGVSSASALSGIPAGFATGGGNGGPFGLASRGSKCPPPRLNLEIPASAHPDRNPPPPSILATGLPTPKDKYMSLQQVCHVQAKSPPAGATRFKEAELSFPSPRSYSTSYASTPYASSPLSSSVGPGGGFAFGAARRDEDDRVFANPLDQDPDVPPPFEPSVIVPNFLYLGQEPTRESDLVQLETLGIKEIVNLAVECEDKDGWVRSRFGKYWYLPMQDSVEETGVQEKMDEACRILADAHLQDKPVYVHCRAGKSRSVTIVLAYLVYHNHWPLKRAYAYVAERRQGISPNLGFMAELMNFEERTRTAPSHAIHSSPLATRVLSASTVSSPAYLSQRAHSASAAPTASTRPMPFPSPLPPPRSIGPPSLERTTSDQGGASVALTASLYETSRAVRSIRESMPAGSTDFLSGSSTSLAFADDGTGPTGGTSSRPGGETEKNREVRGRDGTWVEKRREARSDTGEIDRRASRAGLESSAISSFG